MNQFTKSIITLVVLTVFLFSATSSVNALGFYGFGPSGQPTSEWMTARQMYFYLWGLDIPIRGIYRYNGTDYTTFPSLNNFPIVPGEGYWVVSFSSQPIDLGSLLPYSDLTSVTYNLRPGWNLIGFPQLILDMLETDYSSLSGALAFCQFIEDNGGSLSMMYRIPGNSPSARCDGIQQNAAINIHEAWWVNSLSSSDVVITYSQ